MIKGLFSGGCRKNIIRNNLFPWTSFDIYVCLSSVIRNFHHGGQRHACRHVSWSTLDFYQFLPSFRYKTVGAELSIEIREIDGMHLGDVGLVGFVVISMFCRNLPEMIASSFGVIVCRCEAKVRDLNFRAKRVILRAGLKCMNAIYFY